MKTRIDQRIIVKRNEFNEALSIGINAMRGDGEPQVKITNRDYDMASDTYALTFEVVKPESPIPNEARQQSERVEPRSSPLATEGAAKEQSAPADALNPHQPVKGRWL